jgi:ribose transport system permease protein
MSVATPASPAVQGRPASAGLRRFLKRNAWVISLWILLAAMFVFTKFIQPDYGPRAFVILGVAALPFAFATAGQTMAIIAGGIDLSIAAMMALISVTAASLMQGQSEEFGIIAVALILAMGLAVGAVNGLAVVVTRVPDIVVTLSFFFIWEGAALMVLGAPGGATSQWLRDLLSGTVGASFLTTDVTDWIPKALILLAIGLGAVWIPLNRSRLGLGLYAIGSDKQAAFRSGVPVNRTKVASYALAGLFAAMGALALTMNTGNATPIQGPYLMASVAAVVLGGVSLAGGKGGFVGPIVAVFILRLARQDLTFMQVDPNIAQVVEGLIMVSVVLIGAIVALRSKRS